MKKNVITLKKINKKYDLPYKTKQTVFNSLFSFKKKDSDEKFFALKDISLSIEKGQTIGIIGSNGSGKTTLLKIISKIISPSSGTIKIKGSCAPLLEMGVGFQGSLTAKENILLYGVLMGLSKKQMKKDQKEILKFAGVEKFKDLELKKFSSGMTVRLAFSILRKINAEIYLFDEILAVGDEKFRKKSIKIFKEMKDQGKTIIFVSHNMDIMESHCDRLILLKGGKIISQGSPKKVIKLYKNGKYK